MFQLSWTITARHPKCRAAAFQADG